MRIFNSRPHIVPMAIVAFAFTAATCLPAQLAPALADEGQPTGLVSTGGTAATVSVDANATGETFVVDGYTVTAPPPPPPPVVEQAPAARQSPASANSAPSSSSSSSAPAGPVSGITNGASVSAVLGDINARRSAAGLPPLIWHAGLTDIAMSWSSVQAGRNGSGHNPSFLAETRAIGCGSGLENVAYTMSASQTPMTFWMGSPPHRAAIMGSSTHVGVGAATSGSGTTYYTLNFGTC